MSKRKHRGPGRSRGAGSRYTPPAHLAGGHLSDDDLAHLVDRVASEQGRSRHLDPALQAEVDAAASELLEPITLSSEDSTTSMVVPLGFALWLDDADLGGAFLDEVADAVAKQRHGDILTAFATANEAPKMVFEIIEVYKTS